MSRESNIYLFDESRIFEENGEVKIRHISHESPVTDMTPHPTENRVFIKDGEVVSILSKDIQNGGSMSVECLKEYTKEIVRLEYLLP